ncbi:MAG: DUF935 domain-containing protein [Peptococcaceae bacterium]|jgi:phage gp29-like protein|nr:DUF935 domain-containing protein [Peptococcaceae bacterium]MDH7526032.1 DUF935 domain-containing protein [Peptococcaceae bacterium]
MGVIYGPDGKELKINKAQEKPILDREIAVVSVRDKWSSYPSQGLNPQRLAAIFKEADAGDIFRQSELFEEMEEKDPHLFSVLQTRKNSVLGLDWEIMAYSDEAQDKKVAEFIQSAFEFEGLEDAMLDLLDAIGKGFAATEIMWTIKDGKVLVDKLLWRHQKKFTYDDLDNLKVLTAENPVRGEDLPPFKFVVHKYKARSGYPSRAGILRVCAWMYLFKNYSIKDWVTFAEVYGMPLRLGKHEPNATQEVKDALIQAIQSLGTDAAGIISKNTEIEFVSAIRGTSDVYRTLINFCNAEISKAVLGQTLTTEVGDRGSYAVSKTHNEVRQDLKEADCKALAETLRKHLIHPLVYYNYGPQAAARLPWFKFHFEEPEDLAETAKTYSILVGEIGLPVSKDHLYEKFGIPKPTANEEVVVPPSYQQLPLKAPLKQRYALSDKPPRRPQRAVDKLADICVAAGISPLDEMIGPVMNLILQASSLEELRDTLIDTYAGMDTAELEELIARALFIADLYGRWTVNGGI